VSNFLMAISML